MSSKVFLAVIIILILLGVAGALFFFFTSEERTEGPVLKESSPFGEVVEGVFKLLRGESEENIFEPLPSNELPSPESQFNGAAVSIGTLRQIATIPVSGAFASTTPEGNTVVFYIERQTGHIYGVGIDTPYNKKRISNVTIPGIQETVWGNRKEALLVRYLDDNNVIKSFLGAIRNAEEEEGGSFTGTFLQDDITLITHSPNREKIFTLFPFENQVIGTISDFNAENKREIFTSAHTGWTVSWPEENTLSLTTKPSHSASGYMYFLDRESGTIKKYLGGINGLTTNTSPDAKRVLYSESTKNKFTSNIFNIDERTSSGFSVITLPEKCVWSRKMPTTLYCGVPSTIPTGEYPDAWYQGKISFSDTIWEIDVETGSISILNTPSESARQEIDLEHPILSDNEKYLIFTNKKDNALWTLKIAG